MVTTFTAADYEVCDNAVIAGAGAPRLWCGWESRALKVSAPSFIQMETPVERPTGRP